MSPGHWWRLLDIVATESLIIDQGSEAWPDRMSQIRLWAIRPVNLVVSSLARMFGRSAVQGPGLMIPLAEDWKHGYGSVFGPGSALEAFPCTGVTEAAFRWLWKSRFGKQHLKGWHGGLAGSSLRSWLCWGRSLVRRLCPVWVCAFYLQIPRSLIELQVGLSLFVTRLQKLRGGVIVISCFQPLVRPWGTLLEDDFVFHLFFLPFFLIPFVWLPVSLLLLQTPIVHH